MRVGSSFTPQTSLEGRFDESSQKDVLALAARLQREHFETMSASEIEQAASEAGLDAGFVREAIKRISEAPKAGESLKENRKATKEEWAVGIGVPVFVLSVFLAKQASLSEGWSSARIIVDFFGAVLACGVLGLAALGVRSVIAPQASGKVQWNSLPKSSPAAVAIYSFVSLTLVGLCQLSAYPTYGGWPVAIFFAYVLAPFVGGIQRNKEEAFWRGGLFGIVSFSIIWAIREFVMPTQGPPVPVVSLPALMAFGLAVFGLLALAGFGIRSLFSRRNSRDQDRIEMMQKLFELQAALDAHRETRTFLSVDVVGSRSIRAAGSELEAEYSFLQYQTWVGEIVRMNGGEVQHVAGDGAMAMFKDSAGALATAQRLQLSTSEFNATRNRLSVPFAIRCGISEGRVGLDPRSSIGHVQSPVLDRAAILQKSAAPGAIVVGQELVATAMPILESLHRIELPDGTTAYSWP